MRLGLIFKNFESGASNTIPVRVKSRPQKECVWVGKKRRRNEQAQTNIHAKLGRDRNGGSLGSGPASDGGVAMTSLLDVLCELRSDVDVIAKTCIAKRDLTGESIPEIDRYDFATLQDAREITRKLASLFSGEELA